MSVIGSIPLYVVVLNKHEFKLDYILSIFNRIRGSSREVERSKHYQSEVPFFYHNTIQYGNALHAIFLFEKRISFA